MKSEGPKCLTNVLDQCVEYSQIIGETEYDMTHKVWYSNAQLDHWRDRDLFVYRIRHPRYKRGARRAKGPALRRKNQNSEMKSEGPKCLTNVLDQCVEYSQIIGETDYDMTHKGLNAQLDHWRDRVPLAC